MLSLARHLALGLALAAPGLSHATVLTFETTFGTGGIGAYGDRVAGSPHNGAPYHEGGGWTPNVTLDFATAPHAPPTLWFGGYGGSSSLVWALGHGAYNVPFTLTFTPDPGYRVRLESFLFATWSAGTYATQIRVWDDQGSFAAPNLLDLDGTLLPNQIYSVIWAGSHPYAEGPVRFWLSNLGSVGIDSVQFSQALAVPEPGTWALMGLGLAGVAGLARRRRALTA